MTGSMREQILAVKSGNELSATGHLVDEMRSRWLMLTTVSPITSDASGNLPRFRLLCWDSVWLRSALLGGELLCNTGFDVHRITSGCLNSLEIIRLAIPIEQYHRISTCRLGGLSPFKHY